MQFRRKPQDNRGVPGVEEHSSQKNMRNNRKMPAASTIDTGSVNTQAIKMLLIVDICSPVLFAAIVPATPDDSTCVVLTGMPRMSAMPIVDIATNSADAPCE